MALRTLFIMPRSKKVKKWSNVYTYLESKLEMNLPTSTMVRKIGTTCAARPLDHRVNEIIIAQMSHQAAVSVKRHVSHGDRIVFLRCLQ